jgi:hypothetical protein
MERHRAATKTASELAGQTSQTLRKAASVGSKAASEFGKGFSSGVRGTATAVKKTKKAVVGEELKLQEKAESEQQQKLFGLALSVKRGDTPRSDASAEVLKIVDTMSEKKIRDFAKTSHSEVPKKKVIKEIANPGGTTNTKSPLITQIQKKVVDKQVQNVQAKLGEDMAPTTSKQISANNLVLRAQKLRVSADQQAVQQQKKKFQNNQEPQTQNASYEPEGDVIDERTRYAEKTGKNFKTGRPSVEGGNLKVAERNKPPLKYGGSRQEPKDRTGKVVPVAAGEPGSGVQSPAHRVKLRQNARKAAADFRMDTKGT